MDKPIPKHEVSDVDRTCPQYLARSPFIRHIWAEYRDFKSGRLGNVLDMASPHRIYLLTLENEYDRWESYWLHQS